MTTPDAPTEAIRKLTRPLEVPAWLDGLRWPPPVARDASCTRCGGRVENLSQGHYASTCRLTMSEAGFHFCCPDGPGCEVNDGKAAGRTS